MLELLKPMCELLEQRERLAVAVVVGQQGSTPRTAGARMIVRENGQGVGTIGGGLVEARTIKNALQVLEEDGAAFFAHDLTHDNVSGMDMICGGRLEILIYTVPGNDAGLELFQTLKDHVSRGRKCALVTELPAPENKEPLKRFVLTGEGDVFGDAPEYEILEHVKNKALQLTEPEMTETAGRRFFIEPGPNQGLLYIFGAGHVSMPTAALAASVGFRTVVLDDREEFANNQRFPDAAEVKVIPNFDNCFNDLSIDNNSYLVIVTRGHLSDKIVLAQALKTNPAYIGMIGSRRKRDAIYTALLDEGFKQESIDQVYSPIGTAIKAQTPEEIAVSIVGELIMVRAGRK